MNPNDCLEDSVTWNQMIEYVKHSSCTDFTIYSTCTSTGQAFRFTRTGTMSTSYGGTNAGDDRRWRANDDDTYPYIEGLGGSHLKFYTGNDIYFYNNAVEEFRFYDNSVGIKGDRAIYVNDDETYIGHGAGDGIAGASNNTLIGHDAGNDISTGNGNTMLGVNCGALITTGVNNVFLGRETGSATGVAVGNSTFAGYQAGQNNTGSGCVLLGYTAGKNNVADNRLYISNLDNAFPTIYGEFDNDIVKFGDNSAHFFFKFSHDANDAIIETEAANRSIYLKPQGTGLVKFGTYAAKGAEAFAGVITMEDSGGTARKIMVCA